MALVVPRNRLLASSAIFVVAATAQLCRIGGVHPSLEVALNLLWLGVAAATFAAWLTHRAPGRYSRRLELLALVFIFALLFPVISPSDDLAQPLDDDACTTQLVISALKAEKHLCVATGQPPGTLSVLPFIAIRAWGRDAVGQPALDPLPVAVGHASGNHSPPLF